MCSVAGSRIPDLIDGTAANVRISVCHLGLRVRVNSVLWETVLLNN